MEETGESSRSGAIAHKAKDKAKDKANDKGSKKTDSTTTTVPKPSVDASKTKRWASVSPNFVDVGTAVTHNNLDQLASFLQAIMGKMGDHDKKLNKLTSDVGAIKKAFGGDSGNTSRRSSMGSVSHQSLASEASIGDGSIEMTPYDEVLNNLELLDGVFERFILTSDCKPLTKRTKNLQSFVDGFMQAVQQGQDQETAVNGNIISKLQSLDNKDAQDVYLTLSKRFNSHKSEGKKVATVTQSFETDIVDNSGGDGDGGSQSTAAQSPKGRKGKFVARPPKTPAARRHKKMSSIAISSEDEDDEDDGDEAESEVPASASAPAPASTEDDDSSFQP
ncbi:hypothetical protein FGADI_5276 [Fusarium gaditjirri]|uniref:Uncharacterized protein n=1 Tax=Fusarium gaditjirri TaxID=282569 RepID=A0A8H4WYA6_9HYPO|nr:hypothetical protein FGADI_5276 [Fusarium gaditjirri]